MFTSTFTTIDYVIFVLTLCSSTAIGVYFGCFGSKQKSAKEYLYGKGNVKPIPVGLSLYSSAISAVTLVGAPTEIYTFGTQFCMIYAGVLLSLVIIWTFVLPVFCGELKISTPYEYFELRFSYRVRLLSTLLYIIHTLIYMPIVLYSATIAFSEVSGISLVICTSGVGGICIFYTMLGGFSAVIWSDTLQATLMMASCIFVMIKGIINVGGFNEMWQRAEEGERLNFFIMDPNPFRRLTFWSAIIGMCFNNAAHSGCSASGIQRFMSLKSEKQARISTFIGIFCAVFIGIVSCIIGLAMFAQYYNCDPVKNKDVVNYNKLFSQYVGYTVKDIPGFLGFFNAGILSAGLSTLSAELNTVSGLIYYCFIKRMYKKSISDKNGAFIMKIVVLIVGSFYLIVAPILDKVKYIFTLGLSLTGLTYGAKIGIIVLGTTFPKVNSKGVISGVVTSILLLSWINFGAIYYNTHSTNPSPFSTKNCTSNNIKENFNSTIQTEDLGMTNDDPLYIYNLSFMYYPVLGTFVTILVGLIVSYITGVNDVSNMDPHLFIPSVRLKNNDEFIDEKLKMLKCAESSK